MRLTVGRACLRSSLVALAFVTLACSGPGDAGDPVPNPEPARATSIAPTTSRSGATVTSTRPPARGGTLTMAVLDPAAGLDPIVAVGDGSAGGTELLAVYDSLLRFDPSTGAYVPRTAESVVPNSDATVWTVTIRPGITFSDGTAYDADAVKFGLDRHRSGQAGAPPCETLRACPRNAQPSATSMALVRDIAVTGRLTLTVTLAAPWADFAWVLATEPGMIPSPTALRAACPADPSARPKDCAFNAAPVGAGPFTVSSFTPGSGVVMKRNERYWGGSPPLDGVRFVASADGGGVRSLDALTTGTVDVAFLHDQRAVAASKEKRLPGRGAVLHGGVTEAMNLGLTVDCRDGRPAGPCTGKPDGVIETTPATRFLRVRLAIAAAIDPEVVAERTTGSRTNGNGDLFGSDTSLSPRVPGHVYDPARARRLVAEAKANGWNGEVRYLCDNSPTGQARGIAIETMLTAVGIVPVVDTSRDASAVRDVAFVTKNFDIVCSSFSHTADATTGLADGTTLASLTGRVLSTSATNLTGWRNGRVDAAVAALRGARTDAERRAATGVIVEEMVKDAPFVVTGSVEDEVIWSTRVHGVVASTGSRVLLDAAWLAGTTSG